MKRYLISSIFAVIGLTLLLSLSLTITTFAQDALNSEEYMAQHDGGDGAPTYRKWKTVTLLLRATS